MSHIKTIATALSVMCLVVNAKKPNEEMLLSISVMRHGAREASRIYQWAKNAEENFSQSGELFLLGKQQEFALGQTLRKRYVHDYKLLGPHYDPNDVHAESSFTHRTYESALYELMGLYPHETANADDYALYEIGLEEDFLSNKQLQGPSSSNNFEVEMQASSLVDYTVQLNEVDCPRYATVSNQIKASTQFNTIVSYLNTNFKSRLESLIGSTIPNYQEFNFMCQYIYWADVKGFDLFFSYTNKDLAWCNAVIDASLYYIGYGLDELWKLGAYNFLNIFYDAATALQQQEDGAEVDLKKFMHFNGHLYTLSKLTEALGLHRANKFEYTSGLYFEFYKEKKNDLSQVYVRIQEYYIHTNEFSTLQILGQDYITLQQFIDFLGGKLDDIGHFDIATKCSDTNYTPVADDYYPPEQALNEILEYYQLP